MDVTEKALQNLKADLRKSRIIKGMHSQFTVWPNGQLVLNLRTKHEIFKDTEKGYKRRFSRLTRRIRR